MFQTSDINEQIAKEFLTDSKDFLIRFNRNKWEALAACICTLHQVIQECPVPAFISFQKCTMLSLLNPEPLNCRV